MEFGAAQMSFHGGLLVKRDFFYTTWPPANIVLREKIKHRLNRPVGRPSQSKGKQIYEDFDYQVASRE